MVQQSKIQFFSEVDLNEQGNPKSDMPAWYLERLVETMTEDLSKKERQLKSGVLDPEQVARVTEEVRAERARLKEIKEGKPKLTAAQKDQCFNEYENLGKQIQASMPTRKQTRNGLVDPYTEMKRMKTKHVEINPQLAKSLGVNPVGGKITGDEANKCYQILGKALGESTSVERLRRDGKSEAYHTIHELTQAILEGKKVEGV